MLENKLYFMGKSVQIEHFFRKKTALFAVFQFDFDAIVPTSSERTHDALYMCITLK